MHRRAACRILAAARFLEFVLGEGRIKTATKMSRLTPQWREQQAEAHRLDVAIEENLTLLGFGSESEGER